MAGVGNSQSQSQNQKQEQRMVAIPTNIAIGECLSKSDDELLKQINDELEVNPALEKVSDEESGNDENISGSEGDSDNDSDSIIIRAFESKNAKTRCTIKTGDALKGVFECNMLEEADVPVNFCGDSFETEFKPFEIKTFKLDF